jgi:hypothetical protein
LPFQDAATPAGRPFAPAVPAFAIPVAPVVVCVILVRAVLIQSVGVADAAVVVFAEVTVIVPVAFTLPQPPESGIV